MKYILGATLRQAEQWAAAHLPGTVWAPLDAPFRLHGGRGDSEVLVLPGAQHRPDCSRLLELAEQLLVPVRWIPN